MKNSIFNAVCKTRYLALLVVLIFTCGNAWGAITNNNNGTYTETSGTGSAGTGTITWSFAGGNITVVQSATGGNAPGNYLEAARIYRYNTLSCTASNGFKIEKVEIVCSSTKYGANIGAGSSMSGNSVTGTSDVTSDVAYTSGHTHSFTPTTAGAKTQMYIRNANTGNTNVQIQWASGGLKVTYSYTAPTAVAKGTVTSSSFGLSITDALNTNKYDVYFSTSSTAPTATSSATVANQTTKTPTISSGVSAGQNYYVWVRSVKTISSNTWKSLWTAMTSNPLSTPSAGTSVSLSSASTTNGSFTLSANSVTTTSSSGSVTVTCSPDPGYYVSAISATTPTTHPSGSISYGGSANSRTVTYPTGWNGDSEISVTFSPIWYLKGDFNTWGTSDPLTNITSNVATVTKSLSKTTAYGFKVYNAQEDAWYGNDGKIIDDISGWVFSTDENNCTVFATVADDYTFKFNISNKQMQVIYPTMTHPNDAYVYLTKWWDCYVHYWYTDGGGDHALIDWGYDSQLSRYEEICETDYWCVPILDGYPNLIMKDAAGDPSNTTGNQTTNSNAGKYITHNGSAWVWNTFGTYTISYAGGSGGSGSMSSHSSLCPGSSQALSANTFTKDHYHFTGWIADVNVTINSATVTAGTLITGTPTLQNVQSDITLTAQWEANSNTLTWNWGGGSTTSTSYTLYPATSGSVNYNAAITKPADNTMTKTGYNFSSWSSNATTMPDEDLTITAQWTAKTTSITLNKNNEDASGSTAGSASWTYDQTTKNSLTAATRTGYNVDGYYTAASSGTKILNADGSLAGNSITVDAVVYTSGGKWAYDGTSLTLYAHWTLKMTTVSFNQNSGTGGQTTTKTATYSQAMPTPISTPTRAGYTFTGYFENSGGTGTKYYNADGSSATNWNKENSTWTLYAGWSEKTDTYKTALHTGASGWTNYASGVTKNGAGYTIPNPGSVAKGGGSTCEDTHYYFAGWITDDDKEAGDFSTIIPATGTTDATGTTYWAVWKKEAAGGGGTSSITITRSTTGITATGYGSGVERTWTQSEIDFGGHYIMTNNANTPSGASAQQYIVMQKSNGTLYNTEELPGAITEVEVIQYSELACNVYCGDERLMASNNTSGGQTPSGTLITKPDDATTMTWTISASNNYRFFALKAYTSSSSGTNYITSVKVTYSTITYEDPKAVCEACVATPSISGVSLTGSSFSTTSVPVQATGASAGDNCSLASYGFYWGTSASPTTNNTASDNLSTGTFSATLTGTFTIGTTYYYRAYATNEAPNTGYSSDGTFTLQNVTFNMHSHGGDAPATQVVPQGGKATDPGDPSATGWTFGGWYDNDSYTGSAWNFGTNTVGSGGVTLHAKWSEKPKYTITLNAGNGTVSADGWTAGVSPTWTKTQANGDEEITFPAANPGCAGWVFKGWKQGSAASGQASFTPDKTTGATLTPTSNVTYYAVYRQSTPTGTTYTKITESAALTTGDYAIVANWSYTYKAMGNATSSDHMTEATAADGSWTNSDVDYIWKVLVFGDKVAFYNEDEGKFLTIVNGAWVLATDGQFFTYSFNNTTKAWTFTSPSGKQLGYDTWFNVLDTQDSPVYLYKRGNTESGNYETNPSCSDHSVTGVANPAAGGTVQLTAAAAKNGDKVWACYIADAEYNFSSWSISGAGVSPASATTQFVEITIGSGDVIATANFTAKVMYNVTWKANGDPLTGADLGSASVRVEDGHNITALPPTPTSCETTGTDKSDIFMGWVVDDQNWSGKTNDLTGITIYKKASQFPVVDDDVTYHAVWAATDETTNEWVKVEAVDDLNDGETVAFISAGDAYYLPNAESEPAPAVAAVTKTGDDINFVNAMKFTAIYNSTYDGFTFESVSATGKYLWAYNNNKGIYISATDGGKTDASEIWYLEDFDAANSASTGYGIGLYATTGAGNYRYLTTYGTSDWRSYKATSVGTGTPVNILANIYHYAAGHKNYMTKCCNTPTLAFVASPYAVLRKDIEGASTTTWAEVDVTFTSNNTTGTIAAATYSNAQVTNGSAYQLAASKWQVYETTGGTLCATTHAYFEVLSQPSGETPGTGKFHVKTTSGQTGQGTYRIALTQAATDADHGNFCETTVYGFVNVTLQDKFVDAVNGNGTIYRDGHGAQLATPTLSEFGTQVENACHTEGRKLKGWIKETDLKSKYVNSNSTRVLTLDGLCETCADGDDWTSLMVAPGTNVTMTGVTWYAVWAYEK